MAGKVYMLIGLPGAGKSSFAKTLKKNLESYNQGCEIFSSDEYRNQMKEELGYRPENKDVFAKLYSDLKRFIAEGGNAILDATNINVKARRQAFMALQGLDYEAVAIVICPRIEKCIERNNQREGDAKVPLQVIYDMVCRFEMPQTYEGFSDIVIKHNQELIEQPQAGELLLQMLTFDQKTKYHKYSLGKHCDLLASSYPKGTPLYYAALWHDVGKMFTQQFDEEGNAHYYSHENFSSYYVLTHPWLVEYDKDYPILLRETLFYINNHMHIRNIIKSEKAIKKYKALWGEERYNNLVEFMINDNGASGRIINDGE